MEKETGLKLNPTYAYARESGGDVFVHYNEIKGEGFRSLNEGDRVEFMVTQGQKGPAATDVCVV